MKRGTVIDFTTYRQKAKAKSHPTRQPSYSPSDKLCETLQILVERLRETDKAKK